MQKMINYCPNCGTKVVENCNFCGNCGHKLIENNYYEQYNNDFKSIENNHKGKFNILNTVNNMAGGSGQVDLKLKDLVSNVFQKHTIEERENIFICGTASTTPKEEDISSEWPKPWLYSRIFALLSLTFIILVLLLKMFDNANAYPGIIFIGALTIPFSLLIFFWEVNAPRNINIFEVVKVFFIGGVFSLFVTLILYSLINVDVLDFSGAILIGVIEETGKMMVTAYFLRGKKEKYVLNGLLIGAAVGAGFAVFETSGYIFTFLLQTGRDSVMMEVIYTRGLLAFGCHTVWTAMCGAALVIVKGDNELQSSNFKDGRFIKFFIMAIILHAIWDMPFGTLFVQIGLTIVAWIIILVLINVGLKEIKTINECAVKMSNEENII